MSSELVIRALSPTITIFSVPFLRRNLPVGGRSTAIKLRSGDVFVVASTPCDDETRAALDTMGAVKYLLTPNYYHASYIDAFHRAYPSAKCIGPLGIDEKKPDVKWAGVMGQGDEQAVYGFEDEIKIHFLSGHQNRDIVVLHTPSQTLLEADVLFNLPATEQHSKSAPPGWLTWALSSLVGSSMQPGGMLHQRMAGKLCKDEAAMSRDCDIINDWDFDRIIPCHGEVIDTGGKQAFQTAMKAFL